MAHLNRLFSEGHARSLAPLLGGFLLGLALVAGEPPASVQPKVRPELPDPSATVTVTGLKMRIPPPPLSASDAAIRSLPLLVEIRSTIAFLDGELKRLGVAQAQELAQLKADPGQVAAGMDTPLFASLYRSSQDPELGQLEANYRAAVADIQAGLDRSLAKDAALIGLVDPKAWMQGSKPEDDEVIALDHGVRQMVKQDLKAALARRRLTSGIATTSLDNFLAGYGKIAATYGQALEGYLGRLEVLLRVPEQAFTPSTRVLARLLQLQFYRSYRALTLRHLLLWQGAAKVGGYRLEAELGHDVSPNLSGGPPQD